MATARGGAGALNDPQNPAFRSAIEQIETALRDEGAVQLGEVHVNSSNFAPPASRRKIAADGPYVTALWALAAKYDRPFMIHIELDAETQQELEHTLATQSKAVRLVLAHCGSITSAAQIAALMQRYENVVCDLSFRGPPQMRGAARADHVIFDMDGVRPAWRELIEARPDRFAVGVDDTESWEQYDAIAATIRRGLLANLSPATARLVASENARRWLKLPE
jgi:predicted TIM-barrel fold metal-dependent hydrolase